jgi:hypothetical protein
MLLIDYSHTILELQGFTYLNEGYLGVENSYKGNGYAFSAKSVQSIF